MLIGGLAAATAGLSYLAEHKENPEERNLETRPKIEGKTISERLSSFTFLNDTSEPRSFAAGPLAETKISDLYAQYLGMDKLGADIGEHIVYSPKHALAMLLVAKIERANANEKILAEQKAMLSAFAEHLYRGYNENGLKTDIVHYQAIIEKAISPVRTALEKSFKSGPATHSLRSQEQIDLVVEAQKYIGGKELIAYSLTELMPSHNGLFNKIFLDFLLRSAGEDFVERIPSMNDSLISFGPYQMTNLPFEEGRFGVKYVDEHLNTKFLPTNVSDLSGVQHHQAAYLFMVGNLMNLTSKLSSQQVHEMSRVIKEEPLVVTLFAALSHHSPAGGRAAMKAYAEACIAYEKALQQKKMLSEHHTAHKRHVPSNTHERSGNMAHHEIPRPNFLHYIQSNALRDYAIKTRANFAAL